MAKQEIFFVEVTDTYGGEANYSWVNRFKVHASSSLGAIRKVSSRMGLSFRKDYDAGDLIRYNAQNATVCAFVMGYDDQAESMYNVVSL